MLDKINNIFQKSEFARNTLTLTIGTGIAQLVPMLFYPLLTRLFTPSEFGLLALITSITSVLAIISTGKYENSILIADTKKNGINIIALIIITSTLFLLISFILLLVFSSNLSSLLNEPSLTQWIFICPLLAFSIIIYNIYNEWCVKNKYFKNLSQNKIINSSSTTSGKIAFGVFNFSSGGLIWGDLIGRIISATNCIIDFLKRDKQILKQISIKRIGILAKKYSNFPKYSLPESLLDVISSNLPVFIITSYFLSSETGYYSLANNILFVPSSILSLAVMDVFRQRANEEWVRHGNCINIYKKTVKYMTLIIVPIGIILFLILPNLFALILGKEWKISGEYARILLPNVIILFVFQVVSAVFIIANKLKSSFYWQIFSILLTITSLLISALVFKNMKAMLICFVVARCIANISRFYLTYQYAKGTS